MAKAAEKKPALKQPAKKVRKREQTPKGPHRGMQLILTEDVLHLGKQGQVVEVKPGYGRNYLVPNGLAVLPSPHNLKLLEQHKIRVTKAREARIADLKVLADQIHRTARVTVEANAQEDGSLYGSVGALEISRAMKGKNLLVEPDMVRLEEAFRVCGIFPDVKIALGYDIEAKIEVVVIPQATGKK
jgi:large subunit ribosomal protein L9